MKPKSSKFIAFEITPNQHQELALGLNLEPIDQRLLRGRLLRQRPQKLDERLPLVRLGAFTKKQLNRCPNIGFVLNKAQFRFGSVRFGNYYDYYYSR